jgi:DNA repair protein RadD
MKYELRDYQQQASNSAIWYFKKYKKPFVIQAATGAGKSLIIADICHKLDLPVLILQPSKEILEQNYAKLLSYGITDIGIYSASKGQKDIAKYTFATIGSIYKKPLLFKHFKYVIIDECHQVNPKNFEGMYKTFLDAINCKNVCGLTATPYRIQSKYVTEAGQVYYTAVLKMVNRIHPFFFKKIIYQIETQQLIDQGYLSPIEYYTEQEDLSGLKVNSTGADFTSESLEKFWNNDRLRRIAQAVQFSDTHHERSLVFCSSILQAKNAQALCDGLKVQTAVVTGKTPKNERETIIREFKDGKIKHILNVGVFTTGFDMPNLDSIILARPTMSLALYYQMVGRGVRLDPSKPNKVLKVYDLAGVVERLGRVETIKVVKEDDGFKDKVISEVGTMSEVALFRFLVKKDIFKRKEEP